MSVAPFMQLYVADYLADTQHLTTEQHGAYLLLLMSMWRAGGKLPSSPKILARVAQVTPSRWHKIADALMPFFVQEGEFITQKRLKTEHEKAVLKSQLRKQSGKLGGQAKALKDKDAGLANATVLPRHSSDIRYQSISSLRSDIQQAPSKPTPRQHLEGVLDTERADAVLDHRKRLRKPLSERAAKLLANTLSQFPDPNAAADKMIEKGWLSIDPKWQPSDQTTPRKPKNIYEASTDLLAEMMEAENGNQSDQTNSRLEQNVRYLAAPQRER